MRRWFLGLVLLALVITPAVAQQGPGGGIELGLRRIPPLVPEEEGFVAPMGQRGRWQRISGACRKEVLKEAGISEEKIEKIDKIATDARKKKIRLKAEIEIAALDLENAFQQKTVAKQSIEKLANKLGDLKKEMTVLRATSAAEILSLLSDKERKSLSKHHRKRPGKRMKQRKWLRRR